LLSRSIQKYGAHQTGEKMDTPTATRSAFILVIIALLLFQHTVAIIVLIVTKIELFFQNGSRPTSKKAKGEGRCEAYTNA
jgi:hypothetical protein